VLTIIEHFHHWQIPSCEAHFFVVGKVFGSSDQLLHPNLNVIRKWLPNKKAIQIYQLLKTLEGKTVFVQSFQQDSMYDEEPTPVEVFIEKVSIKIVNVHDIPLPQAFVNGVRTGSNTETEFIVAKLYRVSTINPELSMWRKKKDLISHSSKAFSTS